MPVSHAIVFKITLLFLFSRCICRSATLLLPILGVCRSRRLARPNRADGQLCPFGLYSFERGQSVPRHKERCKHFICDLFIGMHRVPLSRHCFRCALIFFFFFFHSFRYSGFSLAPCSYINKPVLFVYSTSAAFETCVTILGFLLRCRRGGGGHKMR